ncbi:MAG: hypothetical protein M1831_003373 [Alyxoria varia]|nr:MAG: hypothetical protein M1831_003373 [Alyxoria varia]
MAAPPTSEEESPPPTYIIEHLDPELEEWSALEYKHIATECLSAGAPFIVASVSPSLDVPDDLKSVEGLTIEQRSVEAMSYNNGQKTGQDEGEGAVVEGAVFDRNKICLLDPAAPEDLSPEDAGKFAAYLFGGILGDDPPRDRTSELRDKGFQRRRLGSMQMTTDTAVRVTRLIVQDQTPFDRIPFVDCPELKIDEHESTEMPFRYVKGEDDQPVLPSGMLELIKKDSEKGFGDLF